MSIIPRKRNAPVLDEYTTLAASYDRRWRHYLEVTTDHTVEALDPRDGERILDAGCGTGLLLRRVAARAPAARLVGVDRTRPMIRRADPKLAASVVGDIRHLPLASGSLDAVVLASVLQYVPNEEGVLAEAARVLRPGGRIVITAWDGGSLRVRVLAQWLRLRGRADVHLGSRVGMLSACARERLNIRHVESYSAGCCWRLLTLVAIKCASTA